MPRQPKGSFRSEVLAGETPRVGLIASARNFTKEPLKTTGRMHRVQSEGWQKLAWQFFDTVPEFHYSVIVVANLVSRAKLYVTQNGKRITEGPAFDALQEFAGGPEGQTEMLRQYGIHFTVAGDSYTIGRERNGKADWFVAAASEITADSVTNSWKVGDEELASSDLVIRAWRAHPQKRNLPDSPTRAVLPILSEIDGLTKHVAAQIDSRLAGAGILFIPEEMNIGRAPRPQITTDKVPEVEEPLLPQEDGSASDLVQELIAAASESLQDRESASALVPIVIQVKGETIQNVKYQTFWSPLDEHTKDLRAEAIRRLALGMDMPPETLLGTADSNHWNSWQTEEAGIKAHAEPLLFAICDAITDGYLRPVLEGLDGVDPDEFAIMADTTEMRLRPNRSKEALELFNIGALSVAAVVRENGFSKDDMMGDDERQVWLAQQVARGSTTPELVAKALQLFKVPIDITAEDVVPTEARPLPSLEGHPTRDIPEEEDSESEAIAASLVAPAYTMVDRALERAGNRIRNRMGNARVLDPGGHEVTAVDTYRFVRLDFAEGLLDYLLQDAWAHCDRFAKTFDVDGPWLRNALDTYTRELLQFGRHNDAKALRHHLELTYRTRPERVQHS